ncbi:MAG: AI-2E family transporter [Anaerolineaceae bacterium]|nr:AI-2E family transporter [Anaerolineaceae bacterium]
MDNNNNEASPIWSSTTKLVIGLTLVAILAGLLIQFQQFLGPILLSFIVSYLLYPVVDKIRQMVKLSWRLAVTILYLLIIIAILGLATWGGFSLVEQTSSLIKFLNSAVADLPGFLEELSAQQIVFGPYTIKLDSIIYQDIGVELSSIIQPVLGRLGGLITGLASGAAAFFGWMFFILLISYFIVSETKGVPDRIISINIPGYQVDVARIGSELSRIWNAFLRGQLVIIGITFVIYAIFLGGMQVNYFVGLALLAGLARFVPYVGPAVAWTTYGLVALFQENHLFGMNPWLYVLLIVGIAWFIDLMMDNVVVPRLLADALQVHPAAVMVGALIGLSILGVIGVVLAAPVVATIKLFLDYVVDKMLDRDPWEVMKTIPPPEPMPPFFHKAKEILTKILINILNWIKNVFRKRNGK